MVPETCWGSADGFEMSELGAKVTMAESGGYLLIGGAAITGSKRAQGKLQCCNTLGWIAMRSEQYAQ